MVLKKKLALRLVCILFHDYQHLKINLLIVDVVNVEDKTGAHADADKCDVVDKGGPEIGPFSFLFLIFDFLN